jgi:hypothetical protein
VAVAMLPELNMVIASLLKAWLLQMEIAWYS